MTIGAIMTLAATIAIVCVMAGAGIAEHRRRERNQVLGSEYDRVVEQEGGRRAAEREIRRRQRAHNELSLTLLNSDQADYYTSTWDHVQGTFVDGPAAAVAAADQLIRELLRERGYPGGDRDEQLALASVAHGGAVGDYREAQFVAQRVRHDANGASTEEMRDAMLRYRRVLDDVLSKVTTAGTELAPGAGTPR